MSKPVKDLHKEKKFIRLEFSGVFSKQLEAIYHILI